ncbi:MAG: bacterial transcriptional activator domain-containing protein, partial [Paracoccaceae bacterium]|nr:bacterial transcriptional activator domain-containing protein [Paracoccaceae bacterium]
RFLDRVPELALCEDCDAVELTLGPGACCDWHALREALAGWPATGAEALEAALDRCGGTFLEEIDAHWALAPRETAQNAYLAALTCLMHAAAEAGHYEQALTRALEILELDPFREAVHAEAMWLCVLAGQRARAIGRHRDFVRLLRDELGIGPMSETTALFRYVLEGLEAPAATADAGRPDPRAFFGLCEAIDRSRSDVYAAIRHSFARG